MRPNIPPGYHTSTQSRHSSTVDTRVMKPTKMAKQSMRSPQKKSTRVHGSKPVASSFNKHRPSGSRRIYSSRNHSSSGKGQRHRAALASTRRASAERREEYYSDSSEDSSSDEYSESSGDSYSSEGDVATQLDDRGVVVNASDLSECWSKVSIQSEEESAFQRYARKVEAKERQQSGFFFSAPKEDVSLPSLDTKGHTTFTTYTGAYSRADTYTQADTYTEADTYTRADTYTEADTYTRADTYTEADTYTRADTYTEADTYTRGDDYTEAEETYYTRGGDTYTEADTRTYASTRYGSASYSDSDEDSEDSGIQDARTYYTTRTQRTEAVQGNMWMCDAGHDDDEDTLDAQSYGGLRKNEVLIASSRTSATFETRDTASSWRSPSPRPKPRETTGQYGRSISGKKKKTPKQPPMPSQPKTSQKIRKPEKPKPPTARTSRHSKRASSTSMKLEKIEESPNEGTNLSILALPLQWWYGTTREEEEKRKKESKERMELAKRDLLVKPHLHVDGKRGYDGSLTLDARVRKDMEEGLWLSNGNPPPPVDLDGRVKTIVEPEVLNGKKNQPPPENTPAPKSAFAPKETQKIDVWTDGDTEVESAMPDFSGQCKIEAFGGSVPHHQESATDDNGPEEKVPIAKSCSSYTEQEDERGPTLQEEMQEAAFDTVWVAPSAMSSRMSFESHQTLPTINTTPQSVATKEQHSRLTDDKSMTSLPKVGSHERKNSGISNLIDAFEKKTARAPNKEMNQNLARANWRNPGALVAPVLPTPAWIGSNSGHSRPSSSHHSRDDENPGQMMDPEQMMNQQRCLFDMDDERTEVTDDPSTMLQLDDNGQVEESSRDKVAFDPFQADEDVGTSALAFDSNLPFLGDTDPESVQPRDTEGSRQFIKKGSETAFSTDKNNDVENFGKFKREALQSESTSQPVKPFTKPRRRRNNNTTAAGKVKSFLSSFPRRNQKNNSSLESYHQLDDESVVSYQNWGTTGSTVASNQVHENNNLGNGMNNNDSIVRDAMESINGTEQLMRDADSFFAAGSFYDVLDDGFSMD